MTIKKKACELLRLLLQIQTDLRLDLIMGKYREKNPEKDNNDTLEGNTENKGNSNEEELEPIPLAGLRKNIMRNANKKNKKELEDENKDEGRFSTIFKKW